MSEETAMKVNGMAVALVGDTNLSPKTRRTRRVTIYYSDSTSNTIDTGDVSV